MRPATLYLWAGIVWGLLLGSLAAWGVMAVAAGASWLYLFGDEPWPDAVGWVIPLIGLTVFLVVLVVFAALGLRHGREASRVGPGEARGRRIQGIRLLALGLLLGLALTAAVGARIADQHDARVLLERQGAWFETLLSERQSLVSLGVARAARDMSYDMTVGTTGARGGTYRLDWSLHATSYGATLTEGSAELELEPGDNRVRLPIDAGRIVRRYHEVALNGRDVHVEVDESFRLEAALSPLLGADELARLPPHEAHNLPLGQSALIDAKSASFPARFRIRGPDYELLD